MSNLVVLLLHGGVCGDILSVFTSSICIEQTCGVNIQQGKISGLEVFEGEEMFGADLTTPIKAASVQKDTY